MDQRCSHPQELGKSEKEKQFEKETRKQKEIADGRLFAAFTTISHLVG